MERGNPTPDYPFFPDFLVGNREEMISWIPLLRFLHLQQTSKKIIKIKQRGEIAKFRNLYLDEGGDLK